MCTPPSPLLPAPSIPEVVISVAAQLAQPLEVILTGHLCDEGERCVYVCECMEGAGEEGESGGCTECGWMQGVRV